MASINKRINRRLSQTKEYHTERFLKKIKKTDSCWLWISSKSPSGYGIFTVNARAFSAHRYSYEIHKGEIPAGMWIDHRCLIRECVNPEHLDAVSPKENSRRYQEMIKSIRKGLKPIINI